MGWSDEKVNKLKELWGKGKTASQIAEIIGGISRNAVIGKAHRLQLQARSTSTKPKIKIDTEKNINVEVKKQKLGRKERFKALLVEYDKAPEVTRERLYIDALEDVLSSSTKVMIDVEGGNNLLYLPLDQLIKNQEEDDE